MEQRRLGQSSLHIAPLAFGGNVFGWTTDESTSFALLDAFVAAGFNFIDSADVYSRWHPGNQGGESEVILGKWLKARGNRDKVIVATKLGIEMGPGMKGLSRSYMMQAVEASLRRLQTDYIDLYQSHRDDPDTPIEETLSAYAELIKQGKVREIGASNYSAARLAESLRISSAHGLPRYQSLQPLYNLVERKGFEGEIEALCLRALKPLGKRCAVRVIAALDAVAKRHQATPAQVALAWMIARPSITAPIASATNVEQLREIMRAPEINLDADAIAQIDQASA